MADSTAFLTDAPLGDPKEDRFRRAAFAERLAKTLASRSDRASLVAALYGAWGEGKTTVLRFLHLHLQQYPEVVCFFFNPWRFPDEATLLHDFFDTLAGQLGASIPTKREEIAGRIRDLARKVPLSGFGLSGEAVSNAAAAVAAIDLDEAKRRIEAILKEAGKRVIILLDDLDRLEPEEIHAVLRLVKLTADLENTAYVLAFDDQVVASALATRYGGQEAGGRFLEKIVQVPLHLPRALPAAIRLLCLEGVERALNQAEVKLEDSEVRRYVRHFDEGLEPALRTPRMAKRYVNALEFALPVLVGEVNPLDLLLLEGIRVLYSPVYDFVKRNRDLLLGRRFVLDIGGARKQQQEADSRAIRDALSLLPEDLRVPAEALLKALFPRIEGILGNMHYGRDADEGWTADRRICSEGYFERYFAYAIPEGDVSDREMRALITGISEAGPAEAVDRLAAVLTPQNAEQVLDKIIGMESTLDEKAASALILALASCGERLPNTRAFFSLGGPFARGAGIVVRLLGRMPATTARLELAQDALERASLGFAMEIYRWLRIPKREGDSERTFPKNEEEQLTRAVVGRIKAEAGKGPLYQEPKASFMLWLWAQEESREATTAYVSAYVKDRPGDIGLVLRRFAVEPITSDGEVLDPELHRESFDHLSETLDRDMIAAALEARFGSALVGDDEPHGVPEADQVDLRLARQFMRILAHVRAKEASKELGSPDESGEQAG